MNLVWLLLMLVLWASIIVLLAVRTKQAHLEPQGADSNLPPPPIMQPAVRAPLTITPRLARREDIITIVPGHHTIPVIVPAFHPVWQERGWKMSESNGAVIYEGAFQVFDEKAGRTRTFPGVIFEAKGRELDVRVQEIPPELYASTGTHPKRFCFRPIDPIKPPVWFQLHWNIPAKDVSSAILYLEKVLYEAINYSW